MKQINLFLISLVFFSFLIFFLGNYLFWLSQNELNEHIEEKYIEPSIIIDEEYLIDDNDLSEEQKDKIRIALKSAYRINFYYFPENFASDVLSYVNTLKIFLNSKYISNKIDNLSVELYRDRESVRWKMKDWKLQLFWVKEMWLSEYSAVSIHEFAHFVDLYFLEKKVFTDTSYYFYNISWESIKVLKPGLEQKDFVSGYAMTNKYEDFAESFTYYILHNDDFLEKSRQSALLRAKYDFFSKYLFRDEWFIKSDFSVDNELLTYYRDITKIDFSLENFLEFLKK